MVGVIQGGPPIALLRAAAAGESVRPSTYGGVRPGAAYL
jgi:hypothetical protein